MWFKIVLAVIALGTATCMDHGRECRKSDCRENKGFIKYRGYSNSRTRWSIRQNPGEHNTYILHLTEIQNHRSNDEWLKIFSLATVPDYYRIRGTKDQILIFKDASEIIVSLQSYHYLTFKINFYVGCKVVDGNNIEIRQESPKPAVQKNEFHNQERSIYPYNYLYFQYYGSLQQRRYAQSPYPNPYYPAAGSYNPTGSQSTQAQPKCWLVLPAIEEEKEITGARRHLQNVVAFTTTKQTHTIMNYNKVKQTHISLQNASLQEDATLKVANLLTGTPLLTGTNNKKLVTRRINRNRQPVDYNGRKKIATAFFIELICATGEDCSQNGFKFTSTALQQSDLNCIEREKKCRFNFGTKKFNCTPPSHSHEIALSLMSVSDEEDLLHSSCPALNLILDSVMNTLSSNWQSHKIRRDGSRSNFLNAVVLCHDFNSYCRQQCSAFIHNGCDTMCFIVKHHLQMCSAQHDASPFA
ncbi:uncharacterized protein LOC143461998 [Clavelina lepadiformis]|uniref:uncharacterized protein LOC143461998 n=1 Tax=Clavelina lepadiformis TaxID=159417 RepID=UPI004043429B